MTNLLYFLRCAVRLPSGIALAPGALVEAGEPIVRLKRGDRYLLRFAVPPSAAARWPAGTPILWRPEGQKEAYPATVARVAQQVDSASEASGLIRDGLVVRVEPSKQAGLDPKL